MQSVQNWKVDFASIPYNAEPEWIRIGLLEIGDFDYKILLNPTDQKRALRLIVRINHPLAIDRSFSHVPFAIHQGQLIANIISARMMEIAGAKNTNVRYDGNNKFAVNAEREGLHYHILGRYDNGADVLNIYKIDYSPGTKGDIPLGVGKIPLSSDSALNKDLLGRLSDELRNILYLATESINEEMGTNARILSGK